MPNVVTPGTLSEMDMMLCVTQHTLNKQLENLYYTPNPELPEDYLIDHKLVMGYIPHPSVFDPNKMVPGDEGLTAWIGPPTIDISHTDVNAVPFKTIRLVIPLKAGWLDLRDEGELGKVLFADWEMSWVANLGQKDIQKLEEELMHPNAKDQIKKTIGVNPEDFLVSSLFCLFEATQIANSFDLKNNSTDNTQSGQLAAILQAIQDPDDPLTWKMTTNAKGEPVPEGIIITEPTNLQIVQDFKNNVIHNYTGPDAGKVRNPYLLGYTITQTPASVNNTVPLLVPKEFKFTTSPSTNSDFDATLNFAMLDFSHANTTSIDDDSEAGIITTPYTTITKASPSTSGVLAFSRNTFSREYIVKQLISAFKVDPVKLPNTNLHIDSNTSTDAQSNLSSFNNVVNYHYDWQVDDDGLWWRRLQASGTNTINAIWSSTLTNDPSNPFSDDSKRDLIIQIGGHLHLNLHTDTTVKGPAGGEDGNGPWNNGGDGWADVYYDATLTLTTGSDGEWNFVPDLAHQPINLPQKDATGHVKYSWDHHYTGWNVLIELVESLIQRPLDGMADQIFDLSVTSDWQTGISDALKGLSTKVVMPAGDVFEFGGLDTDTTGNVYTHITYKTILSGGHNKA